MSMSRRVAVTGAAGNVGRLLVPRLAKAYDVRTTDLVPGEPSAGSSRDVVGDLSDPEFAKDVLTGAEAVVHLAGVPAANAAWERLRDPNVDMVVTLLDAAVSAGVRRVVLASSVHAVGAYVHRRRFPIDPSWPAAPCCLYGATKVWLEAVGHAYAHRTDLSVISVRFGLAHKPPVYVRSLPVWISPDDLIQLVDCALTSDVRSGIYHGVSANSRKMFLIENAVAELGYEPANDSEQFAPTARDDGRLWLCDPGSGVPR